jgi:hypothetical protein
MTPWHAAMYAVAALALICLAAFVGPDKARSASKFTMEVAQREGQCILYQVNTWVGGYAVLMCNSVNGSHVALEIIK